MNFSWLSDGGYVKANTLMIPTNSRRIKVNQDVIIVGGMQEQRLKAEN